MHIMHISSRMHSTLASIVLRAGITPQAGKHIILCTLRVVYYEHIMHGVLYLCILEYEEVIIF